MNVFRSNGATIHYRFDKVSADAKTLVFINSLGTDFRIWDGLVEIFGKHFNILRHDKRGHGLSALGEQPIAIKTYADDVENLITLTNARNVILVGLSVGGLIAQDLMQRKLLPIKAAILSNTGLKIGNDDMWNSRISGIEAHGLDSISHGVMERWFSPKFRAAHPDVLEAYRTMLSRTPVEGYLACCRAIRDVAGFDHSNLKLPVLCIGGSLDGSTPPDLVKAMAANIPKARYHEVEGAGHLPCIEQPALYAETIAEFIAGI